jgi:hypothetical protein
MTNHFVDSQAHVDPTAPATNVAPTAAEAPLAPAAPKRLRTGIKAGPRRGSGPR